MEKGRALSPRILAHQPFAFRHLVQVDQRHPGQVGKIFYSLMRKLIFSVSGIVSEKPDVLRPFSNVGVEHSLLLHFSEPGREKKAREIGSLLFSANVKRLAVHSSSSIKAFVDPSPFGLQKCALDLGGEILRRFRVWADR